MFSQVCGDQTVLTTNERDDAAKRQKTLIIHSLHQGLVRIICQVCTQSRVAEERHRFVQTQNQTSGATTRL